MRVLRGNAPVNKCMRNSLVQLVLGGGLLMGGRDDVGDGLGKGWGMVGVGREGVGGGDYFAMSIGRGMG